MATDTTGSSAEGGQDTGSSSHCHHPLALKVILLLVPLVFEISVCELVPPPPPPFLLLLLFFVLFLSKIVILLVC